jgi:hypothetical protein
MLLYEAALWAWMAASGVSKSGADLNEQENQILIRLMNGAARKSKSAFLNQVGSLVSTPSDFPKLWSELVNLAGLPPSAEEWGRGFRTRMSRELPQEDIIRYLAFVTVVTREVGSGERRHWLTGRPKPLLPKKADAAHAWLRLYLLGHHQLDDVIDWVEANGY